MAIKHEERCNLKQANTTATFNVARMVYYHKESLPILRDDLTRKGYFLFRSAIHRGYCSNARVAVCPYEGFHGVGYAIMTHNNTGSYNVEYWLLRGSHNGKG